VLFCDLVEFTARSDQAPVAHEDDPERAVRCAQILAGIGELNRAVPALDLAVRVGTTTGEALVRLGAGAEPEGVVGDVVNTASRLQGVAPGGWGGGREATFPATGRGFDYQELGRVRVKGKAEPVAVPGRWRPSGPK
jgi:class 3 adenylate cyclase